VMPGMSTQDQGIDPLWPIPHRLPRIPPVVYVCHSVVTPAYIDHDVCRTLCRSRGPDLPVGLLDGARHVVH